MFGKSLNGRIRSLLSGGAQCPTLKDQLWNRLASGRIRLVAWGTFTVVVVLLAALRAWDHHLTVRKRTLSRKVSLLQSQLGTALSSVPFTFCRGCSRAQMLSLLTSRFPGWTVNVTETKNVDHVVLVKFRATSRPTVQAFHTLMQQQTTVTRAKLDAARDVLTLEGQIAFRTQ